MKDLAIFSALELTEREQIGKLAGKRVYPKNQYIFREGEPADTIYLIKYGRVRLFKVSPEGKEITLDILREDDLFGENTFFEETLHTMNAQTLEETFICSCSKEHFGVLLHNPQVSLKIIQLLGKKLNDYTDQVTSIAFRDVKGRIASTLLRLADEYGIVTPRGITIDINLTHRDLGHLVNASRVMVTKIMGDLKQEGAITTQGNRISLINREKLANSLEAV
jgi:CRP/FNR family transcriptional regulator